MGSGFLIAAQWTIEPTLYIIGFIFVMVQTSSRKQWNLVILNLNGLIAWVIHLVSWRIFRIFTGSIKINKNGKGYSRVW